MRRSATLILLLSSLSCAYVSRDELEAEADADGDGWPVGEDCDDDNAEVYPFAPDLRGDGCNSDCDTTPDADGDDWPDSADCDSDDPAIHPFAEDTDGDGVDSDCDGLDSPREDTWTPIDPAHPEVEAVSCGGDA